MVLCTPLCHCSFCKLALVKPHQLHITCTGGKASAWSEWLQPLLSQAIQAAPLEFSSLWACCVRFAVHSLTTERCSEALGALLDSISSPIPQGELFYVMLFDGYSLCFMARHWSLPMDLFTLPLCQIFLYHGLSSKWDSVAEDKKLVSEDNCSAKVQAPVFWPAKVQAHSIGLAPLWSLYRKLSRQHSIVKSTMLPAITSQ